MPFLEYMKQFCHTQSFAAALGLLVGGLLLHLVLDYKNLSWFTIVLIYSPFVVTFFVIYLGV